MNLSRPLVSLDVESTGPQPETDRVIELGLVVLRPDGARERLRWLLNPGRPIPADAAAVHHITDAHVAGAPRFEEVAEEIAAHLRGVDLVGYNLRAFDLPILRREFEHAGVAWPCEGAHVIDGYVLFKEHEPHKLSTAVRRYLNRDLVDAHSAVADADATLDVVLAQIELYDDLRGLDLAALDVASGGRRPDWATELGHLRWKPDGDLYVAFGRNEGRKLIDMEDGFLRWIISKDFPSDVKEFAWCVRRGERPRAPGAPSLEERVDSDDPDDCDDFFSVAEQEPVGLGSTPARARRLDIAALAPAAEDDIPF